MSAARWMVKKVARKSFALGSVATGAMFARRWISSAPRVRALTYHRIADEAREPFAVAPRDFEAQIRMLAERGLAVSLDQVQRFVAGREELPNGACLITIDDGLWSTYSEALPILERWQVPAVAYVTAALIGSGIKHPEPYMGVHELNEVAKSGLIEIGSHAYTHRSLGQMSATEARKEAAESKAKLAEMIGRPIRTFAYPFGTRGDFNRVTDRALAEVGYEVAFNSMHGTIKTGMDPISLPRVKVEGGEPLWMFRLLSQGAMDPWRAVDHTLFRLQRVRTEITG